MSSIFIDTNILVYAYDADAGDKHIKAQAVLFDCWESETGTISSQVLQEFYVTVTQKLTKPLPPKTARAVMQTYRAWPIYLPTIDDILAASELGEQYRFSFWDSLIIVACQKSGATTLITEDLQNNQQIDSVKVVNPFK